MKGSHEAVISVSASKSYLEAANSLEEVLAGPGAAALNNATIAAAKQIQLKSKQAARSQLRWGYDGDMSQIFLKEFRSKKLQEMESTNLAICFFAGFDGFRTLELLVFAGDLCAPWIYHALPLFAHSLWFPLTSSGFK